MRLKKVFNHSKKIISSLLLGALLIAPTISSANQLLTPSPSTSYYSSKFMKENMKQLSSSNVLYMEATGYSRYDAGCGDYTATGEYLRYGIAAVDPNVISLGTNMYIDGYGQAIAADTGGAIVGQKIDLAFESSQDALNWGRQYVNVYIQ